MVRKTFGAVVVTSLLLVMACVRAPDLPSARTPPPSPTPPGPTAVTPSAVPALAPSPSPTVVPSAGIEPVDGNVLPIAAWNGAPGLVSCDGHGPFGVEALRGPFGAEALVGPEYDAMRRVIAQYSSPGDPETEDLARATYRVMSRDDQTVEFLGSVSRPDGRFTWVTVAKRDGTWQYAGFDGGCRLAGAPGDGWGSAIWDLDPAFKDPTAETRKLHILVRDAECVTGVPAAGRLSPAWVFDERDKVRIQVFVRVARAGESCDDVPWTPATVILPEPLGGRILKDVTSHDLCNNRCAGG